MNVCLIINCNVTLNILMNIRGCNWEAYYT